MAATQTTTGATCECPVCGEFEGQPESVEAHISGLADDLHQGEVGRHHRDDLEAAVVEDDEDDDREAATSGDASVGGLPEAGETTSVSGLDVAPGTVVLVGTVALAAVVVWSMWGGGDEVADGDEQGDEPEPPVEAGTGGVVA